METEDERPAGTPEWMMTYGDMMSILLTFFIMLVSMSELRQGSQFRKLADSLRLRFGNDAESPDRAREAAEREEKLRRETGPRAALRLESEPAGPNAAPAAGVLHFELGQAELTDEHKRQLQLIAEEIGGHRQQIVIRGQAAQQPPGGTPAPRDLQAHYADNWYLTYTRCHRTMEFLAGLGIDSRRFRLGVFGEQEPAKIASRPLAWRRNERVEVLMLNERHRATEFEAQDGTPP